MDEPPGCLENQKVWELFGELWSLSYVVLSLGFFWKVLGQNGEPF